MGNDNHVVLVHGLLGFGPKELGPLKYWGTAFEVAPKDRAHEASVGPISSAHDRAFRVPTSGRTTGWHRPIRRSTPTRMARIP